ncbi:SRPBCC family protein [Mycobacterium sp. PS03-16]|uniref:SRPBCC family protein n=1 Tax=Mycobacterium sp. PS03-16 TaxID=2559611 RepID=UPI00107373B0|nr:SRPBCC family protein [Mycobacterium sp. PS03-16]TFV57659.1 SRPBCC family protein [Mycobacterium sp. PS03-16]
MGICYRDGMVSVDRIVKASPAAAWSVLVDLQAWPKWGPTVAGAELLDGTELGLGERGRVFTPVGLPLPFTITEFQPGRYWAWQVAGIPATGHGVEPTDTGTRVYMNAPVWAGAYVPVLAIALSRIDRMVS